MTESSPIVDIGKADDVEKKAAVLLFWAPWHEASVVGGPLDQVMRALASTSLNESIVFGRVQAEDMTELASKYQVTVIPTFVLVDSSGAVVDRIEGADDVAQVTQAVQRLAQRTAESTPTAAESEEDRLKHRLDTLIRSSDVMLFMKGTPEAPRCGFSRKVVELLQEEQIAFGAFDILSDETVRQGLKTHSNWPTYPQVYVRGELQGGLDILQELKQEGTLTEQWNLTAQDKVVPLEDRLKALINRSKVMLFMKGLPSAPQCGFSRTMVEILDDHGAAYDTFNILEDEEVRQGLKKYSDWPTYPQLYINGDLVGGLDICKELSESGELGDMLDS